MYTELWSSEWSKCQKDLSYLFFLSEYIFVGNYGILFSELFLLAFAVMINFFWPLFGQLIRLWVWVTGWVGWSSRHLLTTTSVTFSNVVGRNWRFDYVVFLWEDCILTLLSLSQPNVHVQLAAHVIWLHLNPGNRVTIRT